MFSVLELEVLWMCSENMLMISFFAGFWKFFWNVKFVQSERKRKKNHFYMKALWFYWKILQIDAGIRIYPKKTTHFCSVWCNSTQIMPISNLRVFFSLAKALLACPIIQISLEIHIYTHLSSNKLHESCHFTLNWKNMIESEFFIQKSFWRKITRF